MCSHCRFQPKRLRAALLFFFFFPLPKGVLTVCTPTTGLNRPGLLKMCQHCREKGEGKFLKVSWGEGKGETQGDEEEKREGEIQTKRERVSCGLNSGQLFKACACSWVGAALIKDAASEQATDAREGGTHKSRRGKATSFSGTKTETVKKKKKTLNNNYRSYTDERKLILYLSSLSRTFKCKGHYIFCV